MARCRPLIAWLLCCVLLGAGIPARATPCGAAAAQAASSCCAPSTSQATCCCSGEAQIACSCGHPAPQPLPPLPAPQPLLLWDGNETRLDDAVPPPAPPQPKITTATASALSPVVLAHRSRQAVLADWRL